MMSYIWPLMIVFSFFCAIATNNMDKLSSAVIAGGTDAITLSVKLLGMICLWNGLIKIAEESGLTKSLCKLLKPILRLLFPNLKDEEAQQCIAMNMTANILGLDNAATPLGLKAMERLQKLNSNPLVANDNMVRFVVINTASIHIVSSTVALLRQQHGSASPTQTILPSILTSILALCCGLIMTTILKRVFK